MKIDELSSVWKTLLEQTGALLQGHFLLSSGLHSPYYLQCALLFQDPVVSEQLTRQLVDKLGKVQIDVTLAPALGGIVLGYELARQLSCRALFGERTEGKMELRRGFQLEPGEKVVICEDVVTTGGSVKELAELIKHHDARLIAYGAIFDRSSGRFQPEVPFYSLLKLDIPVYQPAECPLCQQGLAVLKPGSRKK